ncbi:DNA-processing protein DprA [Aliiroseovarius sp.]|uniref:DNA-processing protein DprA n=1 Tax=Aliiroseovarius sp. TaxID=1872442 RepID=UPI00262C9FE3|nr:DNA-processing protein DprA [Aliiroseovarius sp.]
MDLFPSSHPLTPPLSAEDEVAWLRLLRSRRVGVTTFYRLIREHGTAQAALDALPEVARAAGVKDYQPCPVAVVEDELSRARFAGARLIAFGSAEYPAALTEIPDAPPLLWAMGDIATLHRPTVALVGARNASSLGTRMARKLAGDLAQAGITVVSGLARGIDTAAHAAALDHGTTAAVMAGGVDVLYPKENTVLGEEIARQGVRLSEQPMGLSPMARHFPRRNRIISGLAQAVVVVEAAAKSGSLITARDALDQGREVMAVPGHPFDARASGCNMLIRDGALLVRGPKDVIEAVQQAMPEVEEAEHFPQPVVPVEESRHPARRSHADHLALHRQILDRLGPSPVAEDQLIRDLGAEASQVARGLTDLELDGKVHREPGGLLTRPNT